jgi:ribosomal protein S18 acetylase RimI-like enzyme
MVTKPVIRQAISSDIPRLINMDHGVNTDHVWQLTLQRATDEISAIFRVVRLPRPMRVQYPREPKGLADIWTQHSAVLIAEREEEALGYLCLIDGSAHRSGWVVDLVVDLRHRRQGIAVSLLQRALQWCSERDREQLFIEMQSKNYPAISLVHKLGFNYAGYSDRYYADQDIVLFFARELN